MKIKVEKFLMKQGNRVGKAAIEFGEADGSLAGFHLVGFTICDDEKKGLWVLFPAAVSMNSQPSGSERRYFFLRPSTPEALERLENEILDIYISMDGGEFNHPKLKTAEVKP